MPRCSPGGYRDREEEEGPVLFRFHVPVAVEADVMAFFVRLYGPQRAKKALRDVIRNAGCAAARRRMERARTARARLRRR